MRLLLYEPDPVAHDCFRYLLERRGHKVELAVNSQDLFRLLREKKPDLVVLERACPVSLGEVNDFIQKNGLKTAVRPVDHYGNGLVGEASDVGRCRITLVDTDEQLLAVVGRRLAHEGYAVETHRDAALALKAILAAPPDLVLSELLLPGLDGFNFLISIKENRRTRDVPVVIFSSRADAASVERARELGAEEFIAKPAKLGLLVRKLDLLQSKLRQEAEDDQTVGLSGTLKEMGVADLLQVLSAGRRTALVAFTHAGREARVFFEEGDLVHAEVEGQAGEEALFRIFEWTEGTFVVRPQWMPPRRTIRQNLPSLILEGARRQDEKGKST